MTEFRFNHCDLTLAERDYSSRGRVQRPDALNDEGASALLRSLQSEVDWSIVLADAEHVWEVPQESRVTLDDKRALSLARHAQEGAKSGFALYLEANRRVRSTSDGAVCERKALLPPTLQEFRDFLNSAEGLAFFHKLTANPAISRIDIMATRFRAGNFLLFHDDDVGDCRKAAFVINLTKDWRADWGGLLHFMSEDGDIVDTYVPRYNALHLFKVPQLHAVSYVSPLAQHSRYAISGWIYTED